MSREDFLEETVLREVDAEGDREIMSDEDDGLKEVNKNEERAENQHWA